MIAGLAAVLLVYVLVRKYWGATGGPRSPRCRSRCSPVNVAVDRSNNTESCLILVLLAGVWLGMRAAETGRLATLCAAMAAIGIGFNVKMGAALVLAPVLALTFSLARPGAPVTWHLGRQAIAGIVLVAVSLSWAIFFDLTPARDRPYAGSTKHNSMLELALVHNGAARFVAMSAPAGQSGNHGSPAARYDRRLRRQARSACFGRAPRHNSPGCCRSRSRALFSPGRMHGPRARPRHAASAPVCGPAGS